MIARDLEELSLLRLSEEQTGEGVVIPYTKYFSKEENVGVKWRKNNKKQELKTEARQIQTGNKSALKQNTEVVFDQWKKIPMTVAKLLFLAVLKVQVECSSKDVLLSNMSFWAQCQGESTNTRCL